MNKTLKISLIIVAVLALAYVLKYFKESNTKGVEEFTTETPYYDSVKTKVVATGKLNPEEEIELKPQVSGIIDQIVVEEGDIVQKGDLIAKIRVVPNEQNLASAASRIKTAQLAASNAEVVFKRNKDLYPVEVQPIRILWPRYREPYWKYRFVKAIRSYRVIISMPERQ